MKNRQAPNSARSTDDGAPFPYEPPAWDETELRILDAAAQLITARGIDGLTVTGLAKEARVSRPTIYRRWAGTDEIVRATLLRTTISIFDRLGPLPSSCAGIADAIVRFSAQFRRDPLFSGLLERQPDLFTRYSLERIGTSQRFMLRWISAAVAAGQRDGSVRNEDPADLAVMLLLIAQSATLSHRSVAALIGGSELDEQLRIAVERYLRS